MTKEQFTSMVVDTDLSVTIMVTHKDGKQTRETIDDVNEFQGIIYYNDDDGMQACRYENAELVEEDELTRYLNSDLFPHHTVDEKKTQILFLTRRKFLAELQFPTVEDCQNSCAMRKSDRLIWFVKQFKDLNN